MPKNNETIEIENLNDTKVQELNYHFKEQIEKEALKERIEESLEEKGEKGSEKFSNIFWIVIGIIICAIILFFAFKIGNSDNKSYSYNGFLINKAEYGYSTLVTINNEPYLVSFRNGPKEVENISVEKGIKEEILSKEVIYLTLQPNFTSVPVIGAHEIAKILGRGANIYNILTIGAVISEPEGNSIGVSVVTCENATSTIGVIWLDISNEEKIYKKDNCIKVEGVDEMSIIRSSDRLLFDLLNIMPEGYTEKKK